MAKLRTFLLEIFIFVCFLFIGAAVFQALEKKEKSTSNPHGGTNANLLLILHLFSSKYNITENQLNTTVEQLRTAIRTSATEEMWQEWSFVGSYYFAGTVAFTIGFGHQSPKTALGQLMVILYALIAIPTAALLLSACGEKMAQQQKSFVVFIETKLFRRTPTYIEVKNIAVNVLVLVLIFIISCRMGMYFDDGWTVLEQIYYLWICFTTVGFGDYMINNGKPYYERQSVKTMMRRISIVLLVIGLCQVSCILVSVQDALEANVVNRVVTTATTEETAEEGTSEDTVQETDQVSTRVNQAFELDVQSPKDDLMIT